VVVRVAWGILAENVAVLMDAVALAPDRVRELAGGHPDVLGCHRVRSRGPADAVQLDLHLVLRADMSLERAHAIAHEVEDLLRQELPGIVDVVVHTEPDGDRPEPL